MLCLFIAAQIQYIAYFITLASVEGSFAFQVSIAESILLPWVPYTQVLPADSALHFGQSG